MKTPMSRDALLWFLLARSILYCLPKVMHLGCLAPEMKRNEGKRKRIVIANI